MVRPARTTTRGLAALLGGAALAAAAAQAAPGGSAGFDGAWVGTTSLGGPGRIALTVSGAHATVALGVGHADLQRVPVSTRGGTLRLRLPGRPAPLLFTARLRRGALVGSVRQGRARGVLQARPGTAPELSARGVFGVGARARAIVDDPYGPARLVSLATGEVHALAPTARGFAIGPGFGVTSPATGTVRVDAARALVGSTSLPRRPLRQLEVRFPSGDVTLSGTLTLPAGTGRHAAVAFVHGSGPTERAYLPELQTLLVHEGVAVLAYDKRGIGQSGGSYPGESPIPSTIDILARDAAAAARFLAAQPEVDPARVGLEGHSQAGWIMPLAAVREPAIRFLVVLSGPAVTGDEVDRFQTLTGEGERPQLLSDEEIDAQVLAGGRSGVDPIPWIRRLTIPSLWVYGGLDRHVPPRLSAARLAPLATDPVRDLTVETFPRANHALVETRTGLTAEMLRSDTFAPGLFSRIGAWLRAHRLGG